jgi:hypothetical protein
MKDQELLGGIVDDQIMYDEPKCLWKPLIF